MFTRFSVSLLTLALTPFVFVRTAVQASQNQDDQKEIPPLIVTAQFSSDLSAQCKSGKSLVVQLHYQGAKPLRGYLIRLAVADSMTGRALTEQTVQEARDLREPMILSGADWSRTICSTTKTVAGETLKITPMIDVLRFADGSNWGPISLRGSHELIGTMDGMDFGVKPTELEHFVSPIPPDEGPLPEEQIQFQTIGPLRFESGIWRDENGKEQLAVEATNTGTAPIRGYVFTESFFDSVTRNRLRRVTTKQLETHGSPSHYLLPGATWLSDARKFSYSSDGTLANYAITLDMVVFAHGSIFGPKKSRESDEVLGMFRGIDASNPANTADSTGQKQ
ncbi:MAG: hypothetical protein WBE13_20455 [Candidatus Acidiferrum sp.]